MRNVPHRTTSRTTVTTPFTCANYQGPHAALSCTCEKFQMKNTIINVKITDTPPSERHKTGLPLSLWRSTPMQLAGGGASGFGRDSVPRVRLCPAPPCPPRPGLPQAAQTVYTPPAQPAAVMATVTVGTDATPAPASTRGCGGDGHGESHISSHPPPHCPCPLWFF